MLENLLRRGQVRQRRDRGGGVDGRPRRAEAPRQAQRRQETRGRERKQRPDEMNVFTFGHRLIASFSSRWMRNMNTCNSETITVYYKASTSHYGTDPWSCTGDSLSLLAPPGRLISVTSANSFLLSAAVITSVG
jgi:hypothetical protein